MISQPEGARAILSVIASSMITVASLPAAEADQVLDAGPRCNFNRSPETDPILWSTDSGGVMKLNGIIIRLEAGGEADTADTVLRTAGVTMSVRSLGGQADWRSDAELIFALERGPTVGYRGFFSCE